MYCPKCGSKIKDNSLFCTNCGYKIIKDSESKKDNGIEEIKDKTHDGVDNHNTKIRSKHIVLIITIILSIFTIGVLMHEGIINTKFGSKAKKANLTIESDSTVESDLEKAKDLQKATKINISQVNTDNFPLIRIYFSVLDDEGNKLNNLNVKYFKLSEKIGDKSYDASDIISDLKILGEKGSINLNLVMDVSDSMTGEKIQQAQCSANNFLDMVNYNAGDKIEIISFDDTIGINQSFSNDKQELMNCINDLSTNGGTAFYDSLYTALVETNKQFGNKCVIAFTDGEDNRSYYSQEDIINLSKKLSIPIYIIGIGTDVQGEVLESLAFETGGYYKNVSDINNIQNIYEDVFKNQKAQYVLTYTTQNPKVSNDWRTINICLNNDKYTASTAVEFIPKQAINVDTSNIEMDDSYQDYSIVLNNDLKEDLMNSINKYNSYWFAAMANKNVDLIANATQKEKNRTSGLIQNMKDSGKSYVGYMTKAIFDLDSVKLEQENGKYIAYISTSEYFKDVYYTGAEPQPLPNHKLWTYKLIYDNNFDEWLVDSHISLGSFNPVNKREF